MDLKGYARSKRLLSSCGRKNSFFDNDTPFEPIRAVMPDMLVKGSAYTPQTVVSADMRTKGGGLVYLVALEQGVSTTRLVARIGQKPHYIET